MPKQKKLRLELIDEWKELECMGGLRIHHLAHGNDDTDHEIGVVLKKMKRIARLEKKLLKKL